MLHYMVLLVSKPKKVFTSFPSIPCTQKVLIHLQHILPVKLHHNGQHELVGIEDVES